MYTSIEPPSMGETIKNILEDKRLRQEQLVKIGDMAEGELERYIAEDSKRGWFPPVQRLMNVADFLEVSY